MAALRDHPAIRLVAPMAATVAAIRLLPGSVLSEIVLFREAGGDRQDHPLPGSDTAALRATLQNAGLWPLLRRRPFGGMPGPDERPAAIFVMAADTRPLAPSPHTAIVHQQAAFGRGLDALGQLTDGPVYVVEPAGTELLERGRAGGRAVALPCGPRHPQGLAGLQIHHHRPATAEAAVWDIHAEDVAAIGTLIHDGVVPETRLVRVAGSALRQGRLVRTQPGADLRGLVHGYALPGAHTIRTGSPLDGGAAHWLGPRDRQVTVLPRQGRPGAAHWFRAALTRSSLPLPVIPTAALDQALGGALPAAALVRALGAGEDEAAVRLGALSLLEEDMALADYVLGGEANLAAQLRRTLDRVAQEVAP